MTGLYSYLSYLSVTLYFQRPADYIHTPIPKIILNNGSGKAASSSSQPGALATA